MTLTIPAGAYLPRVTELPSDRRNHVTIVAAVKLSRQSCTRYLCKVSSDFIRLGQACTALPASTTSEIDQQIAELLVKPRNHGWPSGEVLPMGFLGLTSGCYHRL